MVLLERIELSTSPLPRVRSTTELQQQPEPVRPRRRRAGAAYGGAPPACQGARLDGRPIYPDGGACAKPPPPPSPSRSAAGPTRSAPIRARPRKRRTTPREEDKS